MTCADRNFFPVSTKDRGVLIVLALEVEAICFVMGDFQEGKWSINGKVVLNLEIFFKLK